MHQPSLSLASLLQSSSSLPFLLLSSFLLLFQSSSILSLIHQCSILPPLRLPFTLKLLIIKVKASSYIALTDLINQTPSRLFWEASSHMLQSMCEGCLYTYPPLSTARYSSIQLSEPEQRRVKKIAQGFNTAAQHSNPGSLSWESEVLPLNHCALQIIKHKRGKKILTRCVHQLYSKRREAGSLHKVMLADKPSQTPSDFSGRQNSCYKCTLFMHTVHFFLPITEAPATSPTHYSGICVPLMKGHSQCRDTCLDTDRSVHWRQGLL